VGRGEGVAGGVGSGASGCVSRTKIYHSRVKSRVRENQFVDSLRSAFEAEFATEPWTFNSGLLNRTVNIAGLIGALQTDQRLTQHKRSKVLAALQQLPPEVRAFDGLSKINCDVVVVHNGASHFWEFHEEQHRKLSDNRPKKLHAVDGKELEVPRSVQRLIRDWWRLKNLRPLTIVWSDWFEEHSQIYEPKVQPGLVELGCTEKFLFSSLLFSR